MTPEPRPACEPPAGAAEPTSEDRLLGGRVILNQPVSGYRAAIDPVMLAAAVPAAPGERVLDLGCGAGAAALCLLARVPGIHVTGLDLQIDQVRLAGENARRNGVVERFVPVSGDVAKPPPRMAPASFDHVMCNPPYLSAEATRPSVNRARDMAKREGPAGLALWLRTALTMTRHKGAITLIHRAERLDELLAALYGSAGDIAVLPLWPGQGRPAKRVIVRARKGVASPLRLLPGLVLHQPGGTYTAAAEAILRDAAAIRI